MPTTPRQSTSHPPMPPPPAHHHHQQGATHPPSTSAFITPLTSPATGSGAGLPNFPSQAAPSHLTANGLNISLPVPVPSLRSRESTRATDRTDALWAEMQATLEAVELTAGGSSGGGGGGSDTARTSTARVFSPDHERKLDELRAAQIALAQAWARSEADEAIETTAAAGAGAAGEGTVGGMSEGRSVVTAGTGSARPGSSGLGMGGAGGGGQERLGGEEGGGGD
ncbi:hypothetical protein CHGG_07999 [Chaetomium globosum CBS 148.51]|uniref:Uncharacterized protein n=1 Tax=Chaetomium globosum (strain ATCC 6205 / CBS 148.51 / DSM 1962 / NBRC 6347 / NRRL 1970) TaxID=306901 RepID=Q2GVK5_CHAGB|nr:uncharacterized protein CHGG_07999 [Chaetomium globosum CBS 148.51]EAQ86746.1 hypothetical protein CHGG_07999 [Chaetomium globosum CBS 148.51]